MLSTAAPARRRCGYEEPRCLTPDSGVILLQRPGRSGRRSKALLAAGLSHIEAPPSSLWPAWSGTTVCRFHPKLCGPCNGLGAPRGDLAARSGPKTRRRIRLSKETWN